MGGVHDVFGGFSKVLFHEVVVFSGLSDEFGHHFEHEFLVAGLGPSDGVDGFKSIGFLFHRNLYDF